MLDSLMISIVTDTGNICYKTVILGLAEIKLTDRCHTYTPCLVRSHVIIQGPVRCATVGASCFWLAFILTALLRQWHT